MNHTLGIVLCAAVVCTVMFSADTPAVSSSALTTTTLSAESLIVPPSKPWVKKAREQKDKGQKEPEVMKLLKTYTGQEKDGERFHDDPVNRRLLDAHVEQLIVNLNHDNAQQTEEFLQLCAQKNVVISFDVSEELFKVALENRAEREKNYVYGLECSKQCMDKYRKNQISDLTTKLEQLKKQTESFMIVHTNSYAQHKIVAETHTKIYTSIMRLTQKLNPQFSPAYATNPALYYEDIEKEFGLKAKMEEQTELATHARELGHIYALVKQFGTIDAEKIRQEQSFEEWLFELDKSYNNTVISKAVRYTQIIKEAERRKTMRDELQQKPITVVVKAKGSLMSNAKEKWFEEFIEAWIDKVKNTEDLNQRADGRKAITQAQAAYRWITAYGNNSASSSSTSSTSDVNGVGVIPAPSSTATTPNQVLPSSTSTGEPDKQ